jgi:hypothetical protein
LVLSGSYGSDYFVPKAFEIGFSQNVQVDFKSIWKNAAKEFSRSFPSFRLDDILERFSNLKTIGKYCF